MPFGLKNAGATYQRLMDRVFHHQQGRNIEVYVDDILIKTTQGETLIPDIEETCSTLRQYGLKLNPAKCLFGVHVGKFLSYIVTERGIEANPKKVKILRKAQRFEWNEACDKAFEDLKTYLAQLPLLAKPAPGESLLMYLSATDSAANSVLVKEDGVDSATRLLHQPFAEGCGDKALADFLAESSAPESDELWQLYVDGSATKQGSGVGMVLISPQGEVLQLAIRLSFRATNNEAEYEALLAGFQAARRIGATQLRVHSDSQLVAQQVEGNFEIKNDRLKKYAEAVNRMKANFTEVTLCKIPRSENNKADELAKMASSVTEWTEEEPLSHVALIAQVDHPITIADLTDWRTPLLAFLQKGEVPSDPDQARLLRRRVGHFTLVGDQLYKRAFSRPLLKCLGPEDAEYVMKEVHQGCCGNHLAGRSLARKLLLTGYFWPTLQADAARMVATCLHCQKYQPFCHQPTEQL
ncbi:uncharacterized protein LOC141819599 [Curcuma longa]|uniref:uncharacterized protein LOC141819599 n=1 Tax=Curcuma longa TaxID=136217 RepID=UPI003D9F51CA